MKTKIIYISGNEVFEMSEIRAAFDEVRTALGLDNDTILFGVPVDNDNALEVNNTGTESCKTLACPAEIKQEEHTPITKEFVKEEIQVPNCQESQDTPQAKDEDTVEIDITEDNSTESETVIDTPLETEEEKIIPILSVLAANTSGTQIEDIDISENNVADTASDFDTETQDAQEAIAQYDDGIEKITISDIADDDAPVAPAEKTLEQLLESMTPLREDAERNTTAVQESDTTVAFDTDANDTDATLAQLASEFAENEDKITSIASGEPHGKISKLKNILPFKKAKRDDGSLMGDLFGWAGIAANDDDFTMPGFFTGAKKQGA